MKVLVTGATGLLGSNVVRILRSRGVEVRILLRKGAGVIGLEGVEAEKITGDVTDPDSLVRACHGCDAIVHAAAITSQWPTDYRFFHEVNVKGTENVIRAARINRVQKVIHVSTANAFGYGTMESPGTELSEFSMFRFNSGYITSKYIAQQYVLGETEKHGLPAVIVNPSFMIGPYDAKPSSGKLILMCLNKPAWFCPAGGKNFIDVRDAAVAICNALYKGINGECYLLANENLTFIEFYRKVNRVAGTKQFLLHVPGPVTRILGFCGSLCALISGVPVGMNIVNSRLMELGSYFSGKRAADELDMPQTHVEHSICDAIEWFLEKGYVSIKHPDHALHFTPDSYRICI